MNKRIAAALLVLATAVGGAGCAPAEKPSGNPAPSVEFEADDALKLESGLRVAAKNGLELYLDGASATLTVKNTRTGAEWTTNPAAEGGRTAAQLSIEYVDPDNNRSAMNSYDDAVAKGQYALALIENGVRVVYELGEMVRNYTVPPIISAAEMNVILDQLGEDDADYLLSRYELYSLNDEDLSTALRDELLRDYPRLTEDDVYVLTQNLAEFVMVRLEKIVLSAGYTYEQVKAQMEYHGMEPPEAPTLFRIPVDYTLDDEGLCVTVPVGDAQVPENHVLTQIEPLRYFGAASAEDEGYLFVPDGSGALIRFNNGKTDMVPYAAKVYGDDPSAKNPSNVRERQIHLPVFGMAKNGGSYLAVIEEGAGIASVHAAVAGMTDDFNQVYASFEITASVRLGVPYDRAVDMDIFQKSPYDKDLRIRYLFQEKKAGYAAMARDYREYLKRRDVLRPSNEADPVFYVTFPGAVDYRDSVLGVPVTRTKTLTTFAQAAEILASMKEAGIDSPAVRYVGYANGGLNHSSMDRIRTLRKLGGKAGLNALNVDGKPKLLALDVDLQLIRHNTLWDGFRTVFDSPKTVLGENAVYRDPFVTTGAVKNRYGLRSPLKLEAAAASTLRDLEAFPETGVSFASLGSMLASDFAAKKGADREDAAQIAAAVLKAAKDKGKAVLLSSPNAYALFAADHIVDEPTDSDRVYVCDEDVPFYQITVHGNISHAGGAMNMESRYDVAFLKAAETGAGLHFFWMYEPNRALKTVDTEFYAACYRDWLERAAKSYAELKAVLGGLCNREIEDHEKLAEGVYKTRYDNGTAVIVNYSDRDFDAAGTVVKAGGYLRVDPS